MKVLVTGGTGFVGRHIVDACLDRGDEVRVLVRPSSQLAPLERLGVELHVGDLTLPDTLTGSCDGVDAVLHCACAVKSTFAADSDAVAKFLQVNREGTLNLAREILKHDNLRMVHISSTAAMGTPPAGVVDENTACNPQAPYQISKREAELGLLDLHASKGLNVVMLRPCVVAGPGKDQGELLKMLLLVQKGRFPLIGNAGQLHKPMIWIDDLVAATFAAIDRGGAGQIYLIHSGGNHTLRDMLDAAARTLGVKRGHLPVPKLVARVAAHGFSLVNRVRPTFNPPLTPERLALFLTDRRIDISKARRELDYQPTHQNLNAMFEQTYQWYRSQGQIG